jgi:hypothetical protein
MRTVRFRFTRATPLLVVALAALLLIFAASDSPAEATTFRPTGAPVTLSDYTLGANADIIMPFSLQAPDAWFDTYMLALASPEFVHSSVTKGQTVGYLLFDTMVGVMNEGCLTPAPLYFRLVEGSTDNSPGNQAPPVGPIVSPFQNFTEDDGDIDQDGFVDIPAYAGNGVDDGADWYPASLNALFGGQTPAHRYFGWQAVPTTSTRLIIQIVMFDPGDLYNLPSIPSSELLTAAAGMPTVVILSDPAAGAAAGLEDFCTPLAVTTILCGMTDDDPDNPYVEPDCDVGGSSEVRGTNPSSPGTYFLRTATMPLRDADDDGIENRLDTCPLSGNPDNWDPRVPVATNVANGADDDGDNIANVCDPRFDVPGEPTMFDQDQDGWTNRVDNCPLVYNPGVGTPNQGQFDCDICDGSGVPDGGPPIDFIGPECDPHPINLDGHYHLALTVDHMCLGDTDADTDGVCADYPGENDSNTDTDGDGVLDEVDNCIGDANPHPAGLTQMSSDFNSNGIVQIDDVAYVAGKFGRSTGENGYRAAAELASQNGIIQIDDVSEAAGSFGKNC